MLRPSLAVLGGATLVASSLFGALVAQSPLHVFSGANANDAFGAAVAWLGDVDGDRVPDLAVGAPGAAGGAGQVLVLSGATGNVLYTFTGAAVGDALGSAVAGGDIDGDGRADLIAGAPGDDTGAADGGAVWVWSGRTGVLLQTLSGTVAGGHLGAAVAAGLDVDGDGYDDLVAGAPDDDSNGIGAGAVVVWSGHTLSMLSQPLGDGAGDAFGSAVAMLADVDGDGHAELLVGAPGDDDGGMDGGAVRLLPSTGTGGFTVYGTAGDALGSAVAGLGDLDGDQVPDLAVGVPGDDGNGADAGAVQMLSGADGHLLQRNGGTAPGDALGSVVAALGDADGDGVADVIAGAPAAFGGAGAARAINGATGFALYEVHGQSAGDALGSAVAGGADVDGDGYSDWIVGVPGDDTVAADAGAVQVFARRPALPVTDLLTHRPAMPGSHYGNRCAAIGDVDLDGVPDYAVNALFDMNQVGAVRVYSGKTHQVLRTYVGTVAAGWYGSALAGVGDIDGDGVPDLGVGAWHISGPLVGEYQSGRLYIYSGKTGTQLYELIGDSYHGHLGSAVGGVGDADGDGVNDFMGAAGLHSNELGRVRVYSGATGVRIWGVFGSVAREWFGWSAAVIGDVDGDGVGDILCGAPQQRVLPTPGVGAARLLSGRTGAQLLEVQGDQSQSLFGWSVAGIGDADGDGKPDFVVGAYREAHNGMIDVGVARAFSSADGHMLWERYGNGLQDYFALYVAGAGDVDGDGVGDVLAGALQYANLTPPVCMGPGYIEVLSGRDGRVLQTVTGDNLCDGLGTSAAGLGDLDGDGLPEIIGGAQWDDGSGLDAGMARVYMSSLRGPIGAAVAFGAGCPGASGTLPRIGIDTRPTTGTTSTLSLRAAPISRPAWLMVDGVISNLDLGFLGMPMCVAQALPVLALPTGTDVLGKAAMPLHTPASSSLVGASFYAQWLVSDPAANAFGFVVSDAVALKIGDQ